MKLKLSLVLLFSIIVASMLVLVYEKNYESEYVGEEYRNIKSLSSDDIAELRKGAGWGLAKAAELNGVPGPAHILEMQEKIRLTNGQKERIGNIYAEMKNKAVALGGKLIHLETLLDDSFSNRTVTKKSLREMVGEIEKVKAELRIVHLSAHLESHDILSGGQIALYNQIRGYSKDPCQNIPAGHNAKRWKKHNGCQ